MDVFLIPVGQDRYELYCEIPEEDPSGEAPEHDRGFFRGLVQRFRDTLAAIERERHQDTAPEPPRGITQRVKARLRRAIAETVAEQRLLWRLRRVTRATAVHPSDLDETQVMPVVKGNMKSDYDKHRWWVVINTLLFLAAGLLTIVPGPNVIAYYFAFRLVGHFLSMRGARQALDQIEWRTQSSAALARLRSLINADGNERRAEVEAIAAELQLEHLPRFFDRVACPTA
jgi:Mitochondrial K+-H+ exchange-related